MTDLPSLVRFLGRRDELAVDQRGVDLKGLAFSLRSVRTESVTFLTIPSGPMRSDPARVVLSADATDVWARVAGDEPVVPAQQVRRPRRPMNRCIRSVARILPRPPRRPPSSTAAGG